MHAGWAGLGQSLRGFWSKEDEKGCLHCLSFLRIQGELAHEHELFSADISLSVSWKLLICRLDPCCYIPLGYKCRKGGGYMPFGIFVPAIMDSEKYCRMYP